MLGSTGLLSAHCFGAHVLLFGRRSPQWHALAHLLGNDREEQFHFLQRFFFEIPQDAYFIRVPNSGHTSCSFLYWRFSPVRNETLSARPTDYLRLAATLAAASPPCGE